MIQLNVTQKLFRQLPLDQCGQLAPTPATKAFYAQPALDNNPLSGWHANLIALEHYSCLLFAHDRTRFPLVILWAGTPDFAQLNHYFVDALMNVLFKCDANEVQLAAAQRYLQPLQVGSRCDRSTLGTLNQMKGELEQLLWYERRSVSELNGYGAAAWLAESPRTVRGHQGLWPRKEMLGLLTKLADE